TSLERLVQCPFQYFSKYVLGLGPLDEPESEESLAPLEAGSVYHRALYFHFKDFLSIEEALDHAWKELEEQRTVRFPIYASVVRERMIASLKAYLLIDRKARGEFVPAHFEHKLEGEIAGQRFLGIADRIDLLEGGKAFRVIDYKMTKSGRYSSKMETGVFQKGSYLQPPIYHLLVSQEYPQADQEASSSAYGFIEGTPSVKSLAGAFPDRIPEFESLLKGYLERIREGRFSIQPDSHCDYCSFGAICRKSHMPTRLRIEREERRDS
ncbi:MAG: PD-(D/E)XK nuclease family protein, partial [Planctomycetota bacterium]|nr:PD-(D/E)XK nuclease family protein [Planctomycetota bacterium]